MASWAKVGDGSVVLSGEAVYPVVCAKISHSETSYVSRTLQWEAVVGSNVVNPRMGAERRGASVYYVFGKTVCAVSGMCAYPPGCTLTFPTPPLLPGLWSVWRWIYFGYP